MLQSQAQALILRAQIAEEVLQSLQERAQEQAKVLAQQLGLALAEVQVLSQELRAQAEANPQQVSYREQFQRLQELHQQRALAEE